MNDTVLLVALVGGAWLLFGGPGGPSGTYASAAPGAPLPPAPYVPTAMSPGGSGSPATDPSMGQYVAACLGSGLAGAGIGTALAPGLGTAIGGVSGCAIGAYVESQSRGR